MKKSEKLVHYLGMLVYPFLVFWSIVSLSYHFWSDGFELIPIMYNISAIILAILIHEIGHYVTFRFYGIKPKVVFKWYGIAIEPNKLDSYEMTGKELYITSAMGIITGHLVLLLLGSSSEFFLAYWVGCIADLFNIYQLMAIAGMKNLNLTIYGIIAKGYEDAKIEYNRLLQDKDVQDYISERHNVK